MVGDTSRRSAVLQSNIFGVVGVVGYESSLHSIAFWASLWIRFQDLKLVAFSTIEFDSQGLHVDILRFTPTEN